MLPQLLIRMSSALLNCVASIWCTVAWLDLKNTSPTFVLWSETHSIEIHASTWNLHLQWIPPYIKLRKGTLLLGLARLLSKWVLFLHRWHRMQETSWTSSTTGTRTAESESELKKWSKRLVSSFHLSWVGSFRGSFKCNLDSRYTTSLLFELGR